MAFGTPRTSSDDLKSDINMIPFIDIMLVLLIIFMLTIPAVTQTISVQLPTAVGVDADRPNEPSTLQILPDGQLVWNQQPLSMEAFTALVSQLDAQTEVHIAGDEQVSYGTVAKVLGIFQTYGIRRINLLTDSE